MRVPVVVLGCRRQMSASHTLNRLVTGGGVPQVQDELLVPIDRDGLV